MKNIMIMSLLAFMSGHAVANNQQAVNSADEKVLTAKEVVNTEKVVDEKTTELQKEEKKAAEVSAKILDKKPN